MKPSFCTVRMGTMSFAIYIRFVIAFYLLHSYHMVHSLKTPGMVSCLILDIVLVMQVFSHSVVRLCFTCWNKLVVLLSLIVTVFKQTLPRGLVWSVSNGAKPNQFHITAVATPLWGTSSSISPVVATFVHLQCFVALVLPYRPVHHISSAFDVRMHNIVIKIDIS